MFIEGLKPNYNQTFLMFDVYRGAEAQLQTNFFDVDSWAEISLQTNFFPI